MTARSFFPAAVLAGVGVLACSGDEDTTGDGATTATVTVGTGSTQAGSGAGTVGASNGAGASGGAGTASGSGSATGGATSGSGGGATSGSGGMISGDDLGALAGQMQPGTWAELTMGGIVGALASDSGSSGIIIHYSINGVWDPTTKCVYYAGGDHHGGDPAFGLLLAEYCESTGAWSQLGLVLDGGSTIPLHGYDHLSIDPSAGVLYDRAGGYQSGSMLTADDASSNAWSAIDSIPDTGFLQIAIGSEFVPGKGLVVYNCGAPGGEVWLRNGGSWSSIASGFGGDPVYHCAAEYSPIGDVVVLGGGGANGTKLWRLNADSTITALSDTPFSAGWGIQKYNAVTDPVTGKLLFMGGNPRELWELDPSGSGSWSLQTGSRTPPSGLRDPSYVSGPDGVISVPISTYGVVLYVSCYIGTCNSFLYKHA